MWSFELFRTVDGLRLTELPVVPFSWSLSVRDANMDGNPDNLSDEEFGNITFGLDALDQVFGLTGSKDWQNRILSAFTPMKHGIMALWNGVPIVGGPIAPLVDVSRAGVSLSVGSYWDILEKRYMVPEEFAADRQIKISKQQLYSIARYILERSMQKPAGALPIVLPNIGWGNHERTWQAFNVANLGVAKLLEELSNVINGPDLMLRPRINEQRFEWELLHGTDRNPYIGQSKIHDWEEDSHESGELLATISSAYVAHRVYAVGDGEDTGTHVARVDSPVPTDWPLLETVVSDSGIVREKDKQGHRLRSFASGHLNAFPVLGLQMKVDGSGTNPLGTFWPGEVARVTTQGNPAIADGTYDLRILSMSGNESSVVNLEFDPVVLDII